jgi:hypothetical protein
VAAPALGHRRRERVGELHRRAQVHVERAVDLPRREAVHPAARRQRRVGHEHVDLPGPARDRSDGVRVGQVGRQHGRLPAQLVAQPLEHLRAPARQDHARAARVEGASNGLPDPSARTRQQDAGAGQLHGADTTPGAVFATATRVTRRHLT